MNLLLIAFIALLLNLGISIYLYSLIGFSIQKKKIFKRLNFFIFILISVLTGFFMNLFNDLNLIDLIIAIFGFLCLRLSGGFYIPFNFYLKLPLNRIDRFNFDSILYLKLENPKKHGAMLKNFVISWRWLLLGISLYIFTGYFSIEF